MSGSDVKLRGVIVGRVTDIARATRRQRPGRHAAARRTSLARGPGRRGRPGSCRRPSSVRRSSTWCRRSGRATHARGRRRGPGRTRPPTPSSSSRRSTTSTRWSRHSAPPSSPTTIGAAAVALHGRGDQLGRTAELLDELPAPAQPGDAAGPRATCAGWPTASRWSATSPPTCSRRPTTAWSTARTIVDEQAAIERDPAAAAPASPATPTPSSGRTGTTWPRFIDNGYRLIDAVYDNRSIGFTGATRPTSRSPRWWPARSRTARGRPSRLRVDAPRRLRRGRRPRREDPMTGLSDPCEPAAGPGRLAPLAATQRRGTDRSRGD